MLRRTGDSEKSAKSVVRNGERVSGAGVLDKVGFEPRVKD